MATRQRPQRESVSMVKVIGSYMELNNENKNRSHNGEFPC